MQSLCKAVKAVINKRSLSSGPVAVWLLPHHSWDREGRHRQRAPAEIGKLPSNVLGFQQRPKNQTPKEKRRQREHSSSCPTLLSVQPNSIQELLELDVVSLWIFSPTTLGQSAPELTVNSNIHSISQKGVPSSAACYVKDHILHCALNLSFSIWCSWDPASLSRDSQ